MAQNYIVFN